MGENFAKIGEILKIFVKSCQKFVKLVKFKIVNIFKIDDTQIMIHLTIDTTAQTLTVYDDDALIRQFRVSTAKNGTGQLEGSGCTPLGQHIISDKIGGKFPKHAVFVGRVFTGEIYDEVLGQTHPERDWILSRILWLSGCEQGFNAGKTADGVVCDTHARYIYIHGTPDSEPMGVPMSHGCVRMRNDDVVALYDMVDVGTSVMVI